MCVGGKQQLLAATFDSENVCRWENQEVRHSHAYENIKKIYRHIYRHTHADENVQKIYRHQLSHVKTSKTSTGINCRM